MIAVIVGQAAGKLINALWNWGSWPSDDDSPPPPPPAPTV